MYRERTPAETLAAYSIYSAKAGISRIANVTGLDDVGIPVYSCIRPRSGSVSVSMGKGVDHQSAYVSAMMEGIELFQAERTDNQDIVYATSCELEQKSCAYQLAGLTSLPSDHYRSHAITWIRSVNLETGTGVYIPYGAVHTNYLRAAEISDGIYAGTNGLASGNSIAESTVHAIYEILERDAISLWSRLSSDEKLSSGVRLRSISSKKARECLDRFAQAGLLIRVLDLTSNLGVPVFMAIAIDTRHRGTSPIRYVYGSGCHIDKEVALLRALTEVAQVRITVIMGAREDIPPASYQTDDTGFNDIDGYITMKSLIDYESIPAHSAQKAEKELLSLIQRITARSQLYKNLQGVYRVVFKTPGMPVPCTKLLIPYLEGPHDKNNYLPGVRCFE